MAFRRVTIQLPSAPLVHAGLVPLSFFRHNESIEILHVYAFGPRERVLLVRVVRSGRSLSLDEIMSRKESLRRRYRLKDFDVIKVEARGRAYVALIRQRNPGSMEQVLEALGAGVTPTTPTLIRHDVTVLSFLADEGTEAQVFALLDGLGVPWKLIRRTAVRSPADEGGLTARQREILSLAWNLGYFDIPARSGLDRIAALTGLSRNTVSQHLRRAIRRVLGDVIV
jgi:predicted DNA binding protein